MALIPQGTFSPLYAAKGAERVAVSSFSLDKEPVTRREFATFVKNHPEWRRSRITTQRADKGYLADWKGDLDAGSSLDLERPVTSISRNAAAAYCKSAGKRLPTAGEWEYVAAASDHRRDALRDKGFIAKLVGLYTKRSATPAPIGSAPANAYGVRDMHELIWELTTDPMRETHAAHSAHMFCVSAAMGASDPSNYPAFMRYAVRSGLNDRTTLRTLGFRCAA
jgi:formylglycine-generating enzyme required for sulfatase activity